MRWIFNQSRPLGPSGFPLAKTRRLRAISLPMERCCSEQWFVFVQASNISTLYSVISAMILTATGGGRRWCDSVWQKLDKLHDSLSPSEQQGDMHTGTCTIYTYLSDWNVEVQHKTSIGSPCCGGTRTLHCGTEVNKSMCDILVNKHQSLTTNKHQNIYTLV